MYGLGVLAALQLATAYDTDARSGWTMQYLAAGGTSDRYILALASAGAAAGGLLYLLAAGAWLAVATFGPTHFAARGQHGGPARGADLAVVAGGVRGRGRGRDRQRRPGRWTHDRSCSAAVAATRGAACRQGLPGRSHGWRGPRLPRRRTPSSPGVATFCTLAVYPAVLLGIAWTLAPRRLLRV